MAPPGCCTFVVSEKISGGQSAQPQSFIKSQNKMVIIKVTQNNNDQSKAYGKWYGHVVTTETMSYQQLCKHISEHNSVYGEDVCLGVANKLQTCLLEQLLEGKKVQFGDLGTFYLSVRSEGTAKESDFNLGVNINGLYLRFQPSRQDVNDLSSKTLKKKATFINVKDLAESKKKSPSTPSTSSGTESGTDPSAGSGTVNNGSGIIPTPTDPEDDQPGD